MNSERDRILDACLEEVLGGQTPPDLTPRILQALSHLPPSVDGKLAGEAAPSATYLPPQVVPPRQPGSTRPRASAFGLSLAVAAMVACVAAGLGYFALRLASQSDSVAQIPPVSGERPAGRKSGGRQRAASDGPSEQERDRVQGARMPPAATPPPSHSSVAGASRPREPGAVRAALPALDAPRFQPKSAAEVVGMIDASLREKWQVARVTPTSRATDADVCRRLFRRVLGRDPTTFELQRYVQDPARDKRARLVKNLLTDEAYVEEFARAWSRFWTDTLMGPDDTRLANAASREGLEQFLRRSLLDDRPFDDVAVELLTATGSGAPGTADYNGAANFLIAHYDKDGVQATAHTARVFLGRRLACAQCHDDPADTELVQHRFWELNAFFRQLELRTAGTGPAVLANADFRGTASGDSRDAEVFYETPGGELRVAYPALPRVGKLPHDGLVATFDRREFLAGYIARSDDFRRVVVNRTWAALLGVGFTTPVDDLGVGNPPSHPELLQELAEQFAAHDHDVKSLVRWIALSEPFTLATGDTAAIAADSPTWGEPPLFSRYYESAPRSATTIESLELLAQLLRPVSPTAPQGTTARLDPLTGQPRALPDSRFAPPISPLTGLPSFDFGEALAGTPIAAILDSGLTRERKIEHLFLATLHRLPRRRELARIEPMFAGGGSERTTLTALWWALAHDGAARLED